MRLEYGSTLALLGVSNSDVDLGFSGSVSEPGVADVVANMPVNGVECVAEFDWSGWPVGGDEGSQHPVVNLAVEHGHALPVLGQQVGVAAGQPLDEPVDAQPGAAVAPPGGGV